MEMVECVANCTPDGDCPKACIARGDDASKAAARDVLECRYEYIGEDANGACDSTVAACTKLGERN